jgi:hypothetical protein
MRNKLIGVMCLAYMAAAAAGQVPSKPRLAIVRQVDHIIISADTVEDAKALWSLFSEQLKLPVAWPPAQYAGFFSGGVNAGNVNLEFVYSRDESVESHSTGQPSTNARFSGLGLEPEPLAQALPELEQLGLHHAQPDPYQKKDQSGNQTTLWTTVTLGDVSKDDLDIFLCEYSPKLFRPRRDIQEERRYLKDELRQRGGGPMGIELVKEIVIGASDYEATVRLWQKLLGPNARASGGVWHPAAGPAIRFTPSASDGIQSIVVRVVALGRARRFLQSSVLLGRDAKSRIAIAPNKVMGIDVQFVQ